MFLCVFQFRGRSNKVCQIFTVPTSKYINQSIRYSFQCKIKQSDPKMLRLQKITAKLTSQLYKPTTQLYFRILIGKINKTTSKPARIDDQYRICWEESMTLSLVDEHQYEYLFQIFGKERDEGTGDQDTQVRMVKNRNVLRGKIGFSAQKGHVGSWDIFIGNNKKIGTLTAEIVSTASSIKRSLLKSQQNLTIEYETPAKNVPRVLRILSIVARLPNIYLKKPYFCIEIGQQVIKTPELRSRSGQLVFMEARQIQLQGQDKSAEIKIYSNKGDKQQPVAETVLDLSGGGSNTRKLTLMKDSFEAGEMYVQLRLVKKNQTPTTNYVQNLNKSKTIAVNQLQQPLLLNSKSKSMNKTPALHSSLDYSLLDTHIQNQRYRKQKLDTSMISSVSSRRRNSVLNQNGTIMFPRQRRFMVYQDRQNQKISYLGAGERSFEFKSIMSGRYKGASFGYGDKTDFADKNRIPGVGYYKLPSIWDRY